MAKSKERDENDSSRKKVNLEEDHEPLFNDAFLVEHKAEYVKNFQVDGCIICKIVNKEDDIQRMEVFRNDHIIVFLNVYPYTSGHILISPLTHKIGFEEMKGEELEQFNIMLQKTISMLKHFGKTASFNVGWNQGPHSGGSIDHYHAHIVPRYQNDMDWVGTIMNTRPVLHSLETIQEELRKYRPYLAGDKEIEELFD